MTHMRCNKERQREPPVPHKPVQLFTSELEQKEGDRAPKAEKDKVTI